MKHSVKIIFFDIDGTLIDMNRGTITKEIATTLKRLQDNGILLCLATGRSPVMLPAFENIVFDAFLTYNGSLCYTGTQTIFRNCLTADDVTAILENADRLHHPLCVATKDRQAANGVEDDLITYFHFAHSEVPVADDFATVASDDVYQIMMAGTQEEYPAILKNTTSAKIAAWWDRAVDIIPKSGGKGLGVEKFLSYYHLSPSDALAFGDGNNDIEMLQTVGCGVAMGNASDSVKAIANDVCGTVADNGIYHYCLKHQLI